MQLIGEKWKREGERWVFGFVYKKIWDVDEMLRYDMAMDAVETGKGEGEGEREGGGG